jgi:hypothetical protein
VVRHQLPVWRILKGLEKSGVKEREGQFNNLSEQ